MSNEVVKGRGGLWRMAEVGGIAAAAGGFLLIGLHHPSPTFTNLHRPPAADIHTEYVKFPSGRDTITAYLAYPDRNAPALGVYAENDARINAGLADVDAAIRTYHKSYRYTVYPGVGHGFLRAREKPEVADSAWKAVVGFFRESLEH